MDGVNIENLVPVENDTFLAVQRFLFREARLLTEEQFRTWLTSVVHPDISYQVFTRELRLRKDNRPKGSDCTYIFDERFDDLDARVRQYESGALWRIDPPERSRYLITNIEAHETANSDELLVFSNCQMIRNRRVHEESHFIYGRRDTLKKIGTDEFQLLHREVDYDQRYIQGRNLMFFL